MRWGIALIILSVIVYYLLLFFRYRGTKEVHRLEQPGNNNNEISVCGHEFSLVSFAKSKGHTPNAPKRTEGIVNLITDNFGQK